METGFSVGAYQIVRKLGEGGMGTVYEAEHALIGRRAAIKVLHASYSQNQDIVERFFNEARAATAVAAPGIIQIFDFGYHPSGVAYIVMEYLDGEPLDARLRRLGRLPVEQAARICRQVAIALSAAHRRGIVHRDLKPENIVLIEDPEVPGGERVKVLDFGIAKLAGDEGVPRTATRTGAVLGTPDYMSPEQCRGAGSVPIDHRADIYSLGCILFALVTGRPPFSGEGSGDLIVAHICHDPTPPSRRVPGLPAELDAVVLRCLAKQPSDRFASMTELAEALSALQRAATMSGSAPHPMPSLLPPHLAPTQAIPTPAASAGTITGASAEVEAAAPPSTHRRGLVIAGIATAIVAIGVTIIVMAGGGGDEQREVEATSGSSDRPATPAAVDARVAPVVTTVFDAAPAPVATVVDAAPAKKTSAKTKPRKKDPKPAKCAPDDLYCIQRARAHVPDASTQRSSSNSWYSSAFSCGVVLVTAVTHPPLGYGIAGSERSPFETWTSENMNRPQRCSGAASNGAVNDRCRIAAPVPPLGDGSMKTQRRAFGSMPRMLSLPSMIWSLPSIDDAPVATSHSANAIPRGNVTSMSYAIAGSGMFVMKLTIEGHGAGASVSHDWW